MNQLKINHPQLMVMSDLIGLTSPAYRFLRLREAIKLE